MKSVSDMPAALNAASSRAWWHSSIMLLLFAVLSSAAAWWMIAWPVVNFSRAEKHDGHFGLIYGHMIGGTIMLFLGAANLYIGSTNRHFRYHKLLGRTYLIGGAVGVVFVIYVLLSSAHNPAGTTEFTNTTISLLGW